MCKETSEKENYTTITPPIGSGQEYIEMSALCRIQEAGILLSKNSSYSGEWPEEFPQRLDLVPHGLCGNRAHLVNLEATVHDQIASYCVWKAGWVFKC